MREFETSCIALRDGEISFNQFFARTQFYWRQQANKLMSNKQLPPSVDVEDVLQDLALAAWNFALKWDESRGVAFKRYIVWNAMDKANKELNRQRNSLNRSNTTESRFPTNFSEFHDDRGGARQDDHAIVSTRLMKSPQAVSDWVPPCEQHDNTEVVLDAVSRIDVAIHRSREQDPSSASVLNTIKLNRLDVDCTLENLVSGGVAKNPTQAKRLLESVIETYL